MYSHGTGALKKEYYTYDNRPSERERQKDRQQRRPSVSKKKRLLIKKRIMALMCLSASMAFILLFRCAAITKEFSELTKKREELSMIDAQVVEMKMIAESNVEPKRIVQEAERLGLHQPVKRQIKYISLGNTDNGEVLKAEKTNAFSAFINRVSVILDYLY